MCCCTHFLRLDDFISCYLDSLNSLFFFFICCVDALIPHFFLNNLVSLTDDRDSNYSSKCIVGAGVENNAPVVSSYRRCCLFLKCSCNEKISNLHLWVLAPAAALCLGVGLVLD